MLSLQDKQTFVRELCDSVRDDILTTLEGVPMDWDGHELRQLIADAFQRETTYLLKKGTKRRAAYVRTVASKGL